MGNFFGTTGSSGLISYIASSTVNFAQQTNAWELITFAVGPILAFYILEEMLDVFDRRFAKENIVDPRKKKYE